MQKFEDKALPQALKALRREARLTQEEVCQAMREQGNHLTPAWLSRLERGVQAPSEKLLDELLVVLQSDRLALQRKMHGGIPHVQPLQLSGTPKAQSLMLRHQSIAHYNYADTSMASGLLASSQAPSVSWQALASEQPGWVDTPPPTMSQKDRLFSAFSDIPLNKREEAIGLIEKLSDKSKS